MKYMMATTTVINGNKQKSVESIELVRIWYDDKLHAINKANDE